MCKWGFHIVWRCACSCKYMWCADFWHKSQDLSVFAPSAEVTSMCFHTGLFLCCDELSPWFNPESPWKEVSMKDCLQWVELWMCLWGLTLIKLIDVGRISPLWVSQFLRKGVMNYMSGKIELITNQTNKWTCLFPSSSDGCEEIRCLKYPSPSFCAMMNCNLELWTKSNLFSLKLLFVRVTYHNNGHETKAWAQKWEFASSHLLSKKFLLIEPSA